VAASGDLKDPLFDPNPVFNPAHPNCLSPAVHQYTPPPVKDPVEPEVKRKIT
jgi:hypothetical protein